jgi:hypothetical protein
MHYFGFPYHDQIEIYEVIFEENMNKMGKKGKIE